MEAQGEEVPMSSTVVAVALVLCSVALHSRIRRHAGWTASSRGRFLVFLGYPMAALAAYWWCVSSTAWEWTLAGGWSVASLACVLSGVDALRRITAEHAVKAVAMETITPAVSR